MWCCYSLLQLSVSFLYILLLSFNCNISREAYFLVLFGFLCRSLIPEYANPSQDLEMFLLNFLVRVIGLWVYYLKNQLYFISYIHFRIKFYKYYHIHKHNFLKYIFNWNRIVSLRPPFSPFILPRNPSLQHLPSFPFKLIASFVYVCVQVYEVCVWYTYACGYVSWDFYCFSEVI